ncbi:MAG TPA: adenylate/guanylate cyclase domain-containing protein [Stellaceae bacterium]|jgi:class 3 adenylate cyclase|nr:adenylate/guanylate cyclase domain-containing protein [Stellaceae bacterium]
MADEDEEIAAEPIFTPHEWLAHVRSYERQGELFRAFDLAKQALVRFPDDLALQHRAVLCLASTGATHKAGELYDEFGLGKVADLPPDTPLALDLAALRPRLLKDAAIATEGNGRAPLLHAAATAYQDLYRKAQAGGNTESYYPGVNAATLSLLAGREQTAFALAGEVLDQLNRVPARKKSFYEIASTLEAQLVLGQMEAARDTLVAVASMMRGDNYADARGRAAMIRQLQLIIAAKGLAPDWLDSLSPPRVIHYLGHIIAPEGRHGRFPAEQEEEIRQEIAAILAADDVGFGYGSLAAGADILFAEELLARNAGLALILPFNINEFIEVSVRPAGEQWVKRFHACMSRASTVRYATEDRYLGDDQLFGYCSQLAMGLALLRATHVSAAVEQIAIWDGKPATGPAGTAIDVAAWQRTGMPQKIISVGTGFDPAAYPAEAQRGMERRTRAMLFGDIHGFSRLTDEQLPRFIDVILACLAEVIERNRKDVLLANTWGDGLFLVFDDAARAANCALELQEAVSRIDVAANGLPGDLGLRIGLHLGPAYSARDPILKRDNYFGAHVSRAARIEPVTPEGCVYVTETMAAMLALSNSDAYSCEYVGMTEAAKKYGQMRMFLLGRRGTKTV